MRNLFRALSWQLNSIRVTDKERGTLTRHGVAQEPLHRFFAWRRSSLFVILIPTLLAAILATVDLVTGGRPGLSELGKTLNLVNLVVIWLLPLTAFMALIRWTALGKSRRILLIGWLLTFIPPFLVALVPADWWFEARHQSMMEEKALREHAFLGIFNGLHVMFVLLPTALAILPGLIRACLKVKTLLPYSTLPGWFLIVVTPFYLLLVMVGLIAVNQITESLFFLVAVLLTMGGPLIYVWAADIFVKPRSVDDFVTMHRLHKLSATISSVGMLLLLVYLFSTQIFGMDILGMRSQQSLVWLLENKAQLQLKPGDAISQAKSVFWLGDISLFQVIVQYCGRSLFMTLVFADALLYMSLVSWRHAKLSSGPPAQQYDDTMHNLEMVIGPGPKTEQ